MITLSVGAAIVLAGVWMLGLVFAAGIGYWVALDSRDQHQHPSAPLAELLAAGVRDHSQPARSAYVRGRVHMATDDTQPLPVSTQDGGAW